MGKGEVGGSDLSCEAFGERHKMLVLDEPFKHGV